MVKNPNSKIHILFCSRLVIEKGVDILIEVIKCSLNDWELSENIIWHIASDWDFLEEIIDLSSWKKTSINYYGKVSQIELASLMREVDFLYMPSRFLETFGLTAIESLACWTPVIGFKKGGLIDFISNECILDEANPVESTLKFLRKTLKKDFLIKPKSVLLYNRDTWKERVESFIPKWSRIFLIHDYKERIWGAEAYVDNLCEYLPKISYKVTRLSYEGETSPMKRRVMFIFSIISFWRGISLSQELELTRPDVIWMHSILRYYWYWWVRAVKWYSDKNSVSVYFSHHDVGFIAPFPQVIYSESQIPESSQLKDFLRGLSWKSRFIAYFKWLYIQSIRSIFPRNMKHVIFSSFLRKHIEHHFPNAWVIIHPHTYDENIFHQ